MEDPARLQAVSRHPGDHRWQCPTAAGHGDSRQFRPGLRAQHLGSASDGRLRHDDAERGLHPLIRRHQTGSTDRNLPALGRDRAQSQAGAAVRQVAMLENYTKSWIDALEPPNRPASRRRKLQVSYTLSRTWLDGVTSSEPAGHAAHAAGAGLQPQRSAAQPDSRRDHPAAVRDAVQRHPQAD